MSKSKLRDNLNVARPLKRPKLHSSRLLHVLADLSLADTAGSSAAFSEKLALWVNFTQAIKLSGLLNASAINLPATSRGVAPQRWNHWQEKLAQVRSTLESLIIQGCAPKVFKAQVELLSPALNTTNSQIISYEPYKRYYLTLQRDIDTAVRSLRTQVRGELGKSTPKLKVLAVLDATFDDVLLERESKLLAKMPTLLEKAFAECAPTDGHVPPDDGLHRFSQTFQTLLLAELDLRLQATTGLVEALRHESTQQP